MILRALHTLTILGAAGALILPLIPRAPRSWALFCAGAGAVVGVAGLVLRTVVSGHLPIFGSLENTWTIGVVLLCAAIISAYRRSPSGEYWLHPVAWAFVFLIWGLRYPFDPVPLTISEQSIWVDVHVALAWAAFVPLLWAGSISIAMLARRGADDERSSRAADLVTRMMLFGYVLLTPMILVGAWYMFVLFGIVWRWDVVSVSALIAWIGYSIAVHGRLMHGWRGARLFAMLATLLVPLLFLYWVWSVFPGTYHYFDIPLFTPY